MQRNKQLSDIDKCKLLENLLLLHAVGMVTGSTDYLELTKNKCCPSQNILLLMIMNASNKQRPKMSIAKLFCATSGQFSIKSFMPFLSCFLLFDERSFMTTISKQHSLMFILELLYILCQTQFVQYFQLKSH